MVVIGVYQLSARSQPTDLPNPHRSHQTQSTPLAEALKIVRKLFPKWSKLLWRPHQRPQDALFNLQEFSWICLATRTIAVPASRRTPLSAI